MIIDTHVHAVSEDQRKYPRQVTSGAPGEWVRSMSAEMLLSLNEDAGIDRTVLVQPYSAYGYDNSYAADSASKYPGHFASVSILDPLHKDTLDNLNYWVKERGTRGLRLFTTTETEATWLDDPRTFPVWERAGSLGIPICIMARFHQIQRVCTVLDHFPTVAVALDHLALPRLSGGPPYDGARPLFDLVRFPNLYLKFSSINLYAASGGKSYAREFFSRLLDSFGASRMMWGSNFPATNDHSLKEQYDLARNENFPLLPIVTSVDSSAKRLWACGQCCDSGWFSGFPNSRTITLIDSLEDCWVNNSKTLPLAYQPRLIRGSANKIPSCRSAVPISELPVRIHSAPPSSPRCSDSRIKAAKSARLRAFHADEVDRRKAHRAAIEQIGQILSVAGIGGGLRFFQSGQQIIRPQSISEREGRKSGRNRNSEERELIKLRGTKPSNFSWADQLSGRSPRPVDRIWVVS